MAPRWIKEMSMGVAAREFQKRARTEESITSSESTNQTKRP